MRVLVVDDTALFRRVVSDALTGVPGVEVIGTAANGKLALSRVSALQPDLVTLDIEMPEMNGIEVLQALSQSDKRPGVILLSAHTVRGSEMTVRGLELGAFDFLTKPTTSGGPEEKVSKLRQELVPILKAFERRSAIRAFTSRPGGTANGPRTETPVEPNRLHAGTIQDRSGEAVSTDAANTRKLRRNRRAGAPLVLIGVSTGGPAALTAVLPALPGDLNAPVFIVQHMPPLFTDALAKNLAGKCAIAVKQAAHGERAQAGFAYIAPGGKQMRLDRDAKGDVIIRITDDPPENNCKPAVDFTFRSAALNFPGRAVAVILTGMGSDGTQGMKMLKRTGCFSIAQDESTCVVFGMPKEAINAGVVDLIVPLDQVAASITRELRS